MAKQWFVRHNDKTVGPLSSSQLQAAAQSGQLRREFLVSNDQKKWVKAFDVAGLTLTATKSTEIPSESITSGRQQPAVSPQSPPPLPVAASCPVPTRTLPRIWIGLGTCSLLVTVVIAIIAVANRPSAGPAVNGSQSKAEQAKDEEQVKQKAEDDVENRSMLIGQIVDDVNRQLDLGRERLLIDPTGVKEDLALLLDRVTRATKLPVNTRDQMRDRISAVITLADLHEKEISQATIWLDKGDYDKAISGYDEIIRLDPRFIAAYLDRGFAWEGKGDYDKAIIDFNEAIRLDPGDAGAFVERARIWQMKLEYDKAIADCDEAVRLNPNNADAFVVRGVAWKSKGVFETAIADCDKAISINPRSPEAYLNRGLARQATGKETEAAADFRTAAKLNPAFAQKNVSGAKAKILKALDEPTEMEFLETPLKDVVEVLKLRHGIAIQLDTKALNDAGVTADTPITFSSKGTSLKSALRLMLQEHSASYVIDSSVLLITSDKRAKEIER